MTETGLAAKKFSYDVASRLTGYTNGTSVQTYSYDASGNRTGSSLNSNPVYALTYAYDKASNHLLTISGSTVQSFTYDASGNMLTYGSNHSFAYDARGRRTVAYTGAVGIFDQINGLGQRVVSQEPTGVAAFANAFAYDEAGHLIGRYGSNGAVIDETVWLGDLPIAIYTLAGPTYIAPDHLGSPHQMTDGNNAQVWFWDHDPFGNGAPLSTLTENLRFPGQYHDSGTGFAYNYFRDYDPTTGRYIESDPIGLAGGVNTYAYVGGNPLTEVDARGQDTVPTAGSAVANIGTQAWIAGYCGGSATCSTLLNYGSNLATNAIQSGGKAWNSYQAATDALTGQLSSWIEVLGGETPIVGYIMNGVHTINNIDDSLNQRPQFITEPVQPNIQPTQLPPNGPILPMSSMFPPRDPNLPWYCLSAKQAFCRKCNTNPLKD